MNASDFQRIALSFKGAKVEIRQSNNEKAMVARHPILAGSQTRPAFLAPSF
jgi:hypothetical protein